MEQEVSEKGAMVMEGPAPPLSPSARANNRSEEKSTVKRSTNGLPTKKEDSSTSSVPLLFRNEGFPQEPPKGLADLPPDLWSHDQEIPLDRWVLGQQNRLLPAKVNARALVRLFIESPKGLPIGPTAERIATEAAVLGDYLSALSEARKVSRDDALATAFPTTEYPGKGLARYANQFVVNQNSRGELSGLMVDLKLINVVLHGMERLIVPTRMAWEFARLHNPVLDGASDGLTEKFSREEKSLLLRHIVASVPVEAFAYRVILEAVRDGNVTPETIDVALKVYHDEDRAENLSQSFLTSQRSGAISRMSDLGLIERRREGVRVFYAVTEEGLAFLNQCATDQRK
jgi:hypothetical protein